MPQKKKKQTKNNFTKYISLNFILLAVIVILSAILSYSIVDNIQIKEQNREFKQQITQLIEARDFYKKKQDEEKVAKYFEEKTKDLEIEYTNNIDNMQYIEKKPEKEKRKFVYEEIFETDEDKEKGRAIINEEEKFVAQKPEPIIEEKIVQKPKTIEDTVDSNKPKLAVIIDDVTTSYQIRKIQDIGYNVNLAFLPPTPRHPSSAKIAKNLDRYMIHLPLQASSYKYDEKNTLYITDTLQRIENRIVTLKGLYPKAQFVNNHTGSKFTANKEAMDKLLYVLKKHDLTFVDSRTTAKSVAKESAKRYGLRILSRNIFLDNKKDFNYIQNQLKKAIRIAKKNGSAIAIGHPYNITFEVLKKSKHLLNDLELVFVEKL